MCEMPSMVIKKILGDNVYEFFSEPLFARVDERYIRYDPLPYRDPRVLHDYSIQYDYYVGRVTNPHSVKWIILDEKKIRLFYIQSVKFKNKEYAVFRRYEDMFGASHVLKTDYG